MNPDVNSVLIACALILAASHAHAELASDFTNSTEGWTGSHPSVAIGHQATGGASGGHLRGQASGAVWAFVSPEAWAGDWSSYLVLRFDLAITSGQYADEETAGIVEIEGTNGQTMTWTGPTPLWSWTRYEISLTPAAFGVNQATFDAILADVAELRILGEFTNVNEVVGLDEVVLTSNPVQVFATNLVERFTNPAVSGNKVAGWSPVDDCTLTSDSLGRPLFALKATDWRDGRNFKVASPPSWAGNWSAFSEIRFDIRWTSDVTDASNAGTELVTILGANGSVLKWNFPLTRNQWTRVTLPLEAASFGVDQATFEETMSHVSQIWIRGEFNSGLDVTWFDNIVAAIGPEVPTSHASGLAEDFNDGPAGWFVYDNATLGWSDSAGISSGALSCSDAGPGLATISSPDAWSGDWSDLHALRFMIRPDSVIGTPTIIADSAPIIRIHGFDNTVLSATLPKSMREWTPYTLDLTPATFGVGQEVFDAVMSNVAHITIMADLVNGFDTTLLDMIALDPIGFPEFESDNLFSGFDAGNEGWRKGGRNSTGSVWTILTQQALHNTTEGNPPGSITINDEGDTAYWFSPESWAGDWRGLHKMSFDLKILDGTNVLAAGDMIRIFSPHDTLTQNITTGQLPALGVWNHYQFELSAAAFGVSEELYQRVMRDVSRVGIRSEWINGPETEALDNVLILKSDPEYWAWISTFLSPEETALFSRSGPDADFDGDGISNYDEFLFLTAPNDASDRFSPEFTKVPGGWECSFLAKSGRTYQLEHSPDLGQTVPWLSYGTEVTGDDFVHTIPILIDGPSRFFRVSVSR